MPILLDYLPIALSVLFFTALAVQLFYYLFFFLRVSLKETRPTDNHMEPLSVIICARNEAEHLQKFIPLVMGQDYPDYEVVVVNDCSTDDTEMVLAQLKIRFPRMRYTNIVEDKKFKHNKKLAITVGVKSAKNEHLVFTDADCYPETKSWLRDMQQGFGWDKDIVVGYGGYEERKGFLNKIIRFDSLFIAMNYLGFARASAPYMGVGRNLAYTKTLFFKNKAFATNYELNSGDDDLLVNETATSKNTGVVISKGSIVRSVPKTTLKELFFQKRRHISTADRYKLRHRILLAIEIVSRFAFYAAIIPALYFAPHPDVFWYIVGGIGLRLITQLVVVKLTMMTLNERNLLLYSPLLDVLLPVLYFIVYLSNALDGKRSNYRWK